MEDKSGLLKMLYKKIGASNNGRSSRDMIMELVLDRRYYVRDLFESMDRYSVLMNGVENTDGHSELIESCRCQVYGNLVDIIRWHMDHNNGKKSKKNLIS